MKKFFVAVILAVSLVASQPAAFAKFSVDWGTSNDPSHNIGFEDLGKWFSSNGYASDPLTGTLYAQTGYIGFGAEDSDPFSFGAGNYSLQIVQQIAGNADLTSFGYYTGAGLGKALSNKILAAGDLGPKNVSTNSSFGLYMNAPEGFRDPDTTNWFSDRAENAANQTGSSKTNAGSDPQALIYQLNKSQWLVAWEDLNYTNGGPGGTTDRDFNDTFLKVTVTPEPLSMALFALGGGALAAAAYRRRRKRA